jgi:drug/metabolite transporter (DMT)-like permease
MAILLGPGLVLVFCASQALRDVYFAHVFQGVDFFAIILLAFALSTVLFTAIMSIRMRGELQKLRRHLRTVLAINVTTALAWSCYFFGLSRLEPSVVNTLHSAMGPLTVVALVTFGSPLGPSGPLRWGEYLGTAGMALAVVGLWWVVLSGNSGLAASDPASTLLSLALLLVSGSMITISLLYCKRLHDQGISAEAVTSVRYLALILLAAAVLLGKGQMPNITTVGELATLSAIATMLIVLPLFALQVGIAHTAPLTAHVLRALGPVFVFVCEQLDGRMSYSAPTLACILAYSAAAIASTVTLGLSRRTLRAA